MPGALPEGLSWSDDFVLRPLVSDDKTFHAYVHIPFCTVRCGYCDFNTYAPKETTADQTRFDQSLVTEIQNSNRFLSEADIKLPGISSVFFGGGTPSLFSPSQFRSILHSLGNEFGLLPGAEITTEANPESTTPEFLEQLRELGVTRLSLGVQSFDEKVLRVLDRAHTEQKVFDLVPRAIELGFDVSIDLIYGAPGESMTSWQRTLEKAISLGTNHISAYSLIVETGTALERKIRRGELSEVDEDLNAAKHELADQVISSAGLQWYEVSNWGKPSVHNSAYWSGQNWWGYGPGAHSHISGHRFWNLKHPTAYSKQLESGLAIAGREELSQRQMLEEELMLGLRTQKGVRRDLLSDLGAKPQKVASAIGEGLLGLTKDRVVVMPKGRLLVDRLVVDFLSDSEEIV